MNPRITAFFLMLACAAGVVSSAMADPWAPDPRVDVLSYRFEIEIGEPAGGITGRTTIEATRAPTVEALSLDLVSPHDEGRGMDVRGVRVNGDAQPYRHEDDRLSIDLAGVEDTSLVVIVDYAGIPADGLVIADNRHGELTYFGDNYPDRARHWLPTVDHPSDKALVEWVVTGPASYQVVANGALSEETDLGDGRRRTVWRSQAPLATKVMVFGAARFAVRHETAAGGISLQSWVYPQDREVGFAAFAAAARVLDFFQDRIGPFPYAKLANVQSKTRYGGMENAGSIFYSENAVGSGRDLEGLVAHEIAHQWFGDGVTEGDWHHVWLSEGFATYFTQLYMEHVHGPERREAGMRRSREAVVRFAAREPDSPVVDVRRDKSELLSTNSYQKGGWVLHMLRRELGDGTFWDGIRAYYTAYRDGNAVTADFRRVMESVAGRSLEEFFQQWVFRPGQPRLTGSWSWSDGLLTVRLRQEQAAAPFRVSIDVGIRHTDGGITVHVIQATGRETEATVELAEPPAHVELDPHAWLLFEEAGFERVDG